MTGPSVWIPINEISTKQLQVILKRALKKITKLDVASKLKINNYEPEDILLFRKQCKNTKLRNIYFRLIHNDFFSQERMYRFKMVTSNKCSRCNEIEDNKHLMWECSEVKTLWSCYNTVIGQLGFYDSIVHQYEDIFKVEENPVLSILKVKLIQLNIQIIRPKDWSLNKIKNVISEHRNIEQAIAIGRSDMNMHLKRWKSFEAIQ
jgi:hypothetical protein